MNAEGLHDLHTLIQPHQLIKHHSPLSVTYAHTRNAHTLCSVHALAINRRDVQIRVCLYRAGRGECVSCVKFFYLLFDEHVLERNQTEKVREWDL